MIEAIFTVPIMIMVAIVVFLLEHFVWVLGIIGFLILCAAIASSGERGVEPQRCPRHGCNLIPEDARDPHGRVKPCYLCTEERLKTPP